SYSGGITDTNGTLLGIQDETVWNDAPGAEFTCNSKSTGGGGTGGGISTFVAMPAYQSNAMGFTGGVPAASGRIVPDVSMLSLDPPTVVFLKGNGFFIGGTSMSAPLWAGMMALINQSTGAPQGSPNTELYRLATIQFKNNGPLMFTDITEGDNSVQPLQPCLPSGLAGFAAAVGFDAASGWGPPDLSVLAKNYGQQTIEPITIPSAPPVISNFSAELNGDALTLILLGTSGAGAITETQATLLDGNQAVVSTGGSVPISLRHSTTVGFSVEIDGLSQLPTAENVTLVLKDKFGQLSAPMSFNFSVAAPGGPGLSGATLNGKKFIIQGSGLSGKLFLEVNGLLVKSKVGAGDTVTFKGTTAGLNLQPGPNRIRVLSASGLFSNIFIFQM
ncbi:MAG TPA: hypothetical protein VLZ81_06040, partial [Blastocatellia bacterium]|nr:hypothetical protein [Blastocatellia bacterium]